MPRNLRASDPYNHREKNPANVAKGKAAYAKFCAELDADPFKRWNYEARQRQRIAELKNRKQREREQEELTKRSNVYFIGCQGHNAVKIGVAKDVPFRMMELQIGCPFKLYAAAVIQMKSQNSARMLESRLHQKYAPHRLNGEWFTIVPEMIEYLDNHPDARTGWGRAR